MKIDIVAKEMKKLADQFVDQPDELAVLKQRDIVIDGYDITVYFNKTYVNNLVIEVLQICGRYFTFIPQHILDKVSYVFFGDKETVCEENLDCDNLDANSRKIYMWASFISQGSLVYG